MIVIFRTIVEDSRIRDESKKIGRKKSQEVTAGSDSGDG